MRSVSLPNHRLGLRSIRIWSADWFIRKHGEVQRIVEAFHKAVETTDRPQKHQKFQSKRYRFREQTATPKRNGRATPYPPIQVRQSITEYSDRELRYLLEWVPSDGRLRTNEEIANEMFDALPFTRRGARIEEALNRATYPWERSKAPK